MHIILNSFFYGPWDGKTNMKEKLKFPHNVLTCGQAPNISFAIPTLLLSVGCEHNFTQQPLIKAPLHNCFLSLSI
jgi:hypothetical protein